MFQIPVPLLVPVCGSGVSFLVPILGPFLVPKIGTKNCPFNCFYIRRLKKWGLFLEPKMDPKLAPKIETAGPNLGNFWTKNGPKIGTENGPQTSEKTKIIGAPTSGFGEPALIIIFTPKKKPQPRQACRPKASTRSLFTFSFLFASTTMASLRCLTTASGVVAAAVERFATDAQCKQAWLR